MRRESTSFREYSGVLRDKIKYGTIERQVWGEMHKLEWRGESRDLGKLSSQRIGEKQM